MKVGLNGSPHAFQHDQVRVRRRRRQLSAEVAQVDDWQPAAVAHHLQLAGRHALAQHRVGGADLQVCV